MSKLYMSHVSDGRKQVTRCGHHRMSTHVRGWDAGVRVDCRIRDDGRPEFVVYATGGSNRPDADEMIALVTMHPKWETWEVEHFTTETFA